MPRSGIIQPDAYSGMSPDAVFPYGEAIVSGGLVTRHSTNGYGLVTFGFLWQLYDIWLDNQALAPITTTWAEASGASITTTWSAAAGSSVSTSWTAVQFGIWGEYQS